LAALQPNGKLLAWGTADGTVLVVTWMRPSNAWTGSVWDGVDCVSLVEGDLWSCVGKDCCEHPISPRQTVTDDFFARQSLTEIS